MMPRPSASAAVTFDFGAAFDRSRKVAEGRVAGVHYLMKNKITEIGVRQVHRRPHRERGPQRRRNRDGHLRQRDHRHRVPRTRLVPGTSLRERRHLREQISPRTAGSIIIAGAGAIGMEFAYVLKNYGVDVTVVEFLPRALPNEDAEVSKEIESSTKLGVKVLTSTKVRSIDDDGSTVTVRSQQDGKSEELKTDKVLQAIGFAPNVEGYGLEAAGVALTDRKAIGIDDYMHECAAHLCHWRRHRRSCNSRTSPRRRAWWPPRPFRVRRPWRWATTG